MEAPHAEEAVHDMSSPAHSAEDHLTLQHALMFKHPILAALDAMSRHDYPAFRQLRENIELGAPIADLMRPWVEAHVLDRQAAADLIEQFGGRVGMAWLLRGMLDAMRHVGPYGPYLSSWIVPGGADTLEFAVCVTAEKVHLMLLIPPLSCHWLHAKMVSRFDLDTPRFLRDLHADLGRLLEHLRVLA
jgi:hypothetical protein